MASGALARLRVCAWHLFANDHRKGDPLSWRHFVYGNETIGRMEARTALRDAMAFREGTSRETDYEKWRESMHGYIYPEPIGGDDGESDT